MTFRSVPLATLLQTSVACLGATACDEFEPPCYVVARDAVLEDAFADTFVLTESDGVLVTGTDHAVLGGPSTAEIAEFDLDGSLRGRWSIPLPESEAHWSDFAPETAFVWTGDGIAVIDRHTETLSEDADEPTWRSVLRYQFVASDGSGGDPIELAETECFDCAMAWIWQSFGGHVQLLYETPDDSASRFLLLSPSGAVENSGALEWVGLDVFATSAGLGVSRRSNGLFVAGTDGLWLADATLAQLAGPFSLDQPTLPAWLDWNTDSNRLAALELGNALMFQRFDAGGAAASPPRVLSFGIPEAVVDTGTTLAAIFIGEKGRHYFATAGATDRKRGGDVLLLEDQSSSPGEGAPSSGEEATGISFTSRALVTASSDDEFLAFVGSAEGVTRVEIACH